MDLEDRVRKTVLLFKDNIGIVQKLDLNAEEKRVVDLAKMYASDTDSWIEKGDYVTAFSSIEYAHGLLDAVLKIRGKDPYEDHK